MTHTKANPSPSQYCKTLVKKIEPDLEHFVRFLTKRFLHRKYS
jgi:hypothetical protein